MNQKLLSFSTSRKRLTCTPTRGWRVVPGRVDGVRKASLSDNFVTGCEAQPTNLHVSQVDDTPKRLEKSIVKRGVCGESTSQGRGVLTTNAKSVIPFQIRPSAVAFNQSDLDH